MKMTVDCIDICSSAAQMDVNGHLLISYSFMWKFLALLAVHWFADFVMQTHWQASNKSKSNVALLEHVVTYTAFIAVAVPGIFFEVSGRAAIFVAANGALHFLTDWCTSRISSRLFMAQFNEFDIVLPSMIHQPSEPAPTERRFFMKRDFTLHNFFVVVGLDQLIHQVTLALTMVYFFGGI